MKYSKTMVIARKDNFVENDVDGDFILVPLEDDIAKVGSLFHLNETGTFIWKMIDGKTSMEEITNALLENYDTSIETAINDIELFLEDVTLFIDIIKN